MDNKLLNDENTFRKFLNNAERTERELLGSPHLQTISRAIASYEEGAGGQGRYLLCELITQLGMEQHADTIVKFCEHNLAKAHELTHPIAWRAVQRQNAKTE